MPNMLIKLPHSAFTNDAKTKLVKSLNAAAANAEQIPDDQRKRFLCWITIDEVATGSWTCGGVDMSAQLIPCIAMIFLPSGVLDGATRASYIADIHKAFINALAPEEQRQLATSIVLHEVTDGSWGANGNVWRLPDFARAAGFSHLQTLLKNE